MTKIIIIINKLSLGGAEDFFCELGKKFSNKFTFAVLENDFSYKIDFELKKYGIPKKLPRLIKVIIKIVILYLANRNYEKIICFDNETAMISYLVNKRKTKLVIHTYLPYFYKNKYKKKIFSIILREIYKNSGIISVSKTATKGVEEIISIKNINLPIVYNLLNYDKLKLNNYFQIDEPIFFLLTRLDKDKNIKLSIKLIYYLKNKFNLPNIKLIIFGDGDQKKELNNLINDNGLSTNILLKGFSNEPFKNLKKNDVFLNFSNFEGWSRLIHECAYLGLRGITFDCPYGPKEILMNNIDCKIDYPHFISNIYMVDVVKDYNELDLNKISIDEKKIAEIMLKILRDKKEVKPNFKNIFNQNDETIADIIKL